MAKFHDNVVHWETREKLPVTYTTGPNHYVINVIKMLVQRGEQIQDLAVIFVGKDGNVRYSHSPMLDSQLCWMGALLQQFAMDDFEEDTPPDEESSIDNGGADKDNE